MAKISFENIVSDGDNFRIDTQFPDGYQNLNWPNFYVLDDDLLKEMVGNRNGIRIGEAAAFTNLEPSAEIQSLDQDDDFDLNSGFFTALNANDLTVKVLGFDDGERVAKKVLTLDPDREFVKFGAQFDDIDEVRFVGKGGTDADPNDTLALTQFFIMDDLSINF